MVLFTMSEILVNEVNASFITHPSMYIPNLYFYISGSLFSATAGPLLPDNIAFLPFNKMWRSPSKENCNDKILRKQKARKMSDDGISSLDAPSGNSCFITRGNITLST